MFALGAIRRLEEVLEVFLGVLLARRGELGVALADETLEHPRLQRHRRRVVAEARAAAVARRFAVARLAQVVAVDLDVAHDERDLEAEVGLCGKIGPVEAVDARCCAPRHVEWWLANAIDAHLQLIIVSGGSWVGVERRGIPADGEHARRIELEDGRRQRRDGKHAAQ